ncbi:hypothetical protein ROZALSC1DRAFT_17176 [Rozella allomycis CSF55]|nr:hypothetical protein ROZALSC1DRAFT_17176 [Rozella allomycis CSF55]
MKLNAKCNGFSNEETYLSKWVHSIDGLQSHYHCILIDEAQFLTKEQVYQLCHIIEKFNIPVLAYGLRSDFRGNTFEGSQYLLALADELTEIKTICHCGKKAIMNMRVKWIEEICDDDEVVKMEEKSKEYIKQKNSRRLKVQMVEDGAQIEIGGNDR